MEEQLKKPPHNNGGNSTESPSKL